VVLRVKKKETGIGDGEPLRCSVVTWRLRRIIQQRDQSRGGNRDHDNNREEGVPRHRRIGSSSKDALVSNEIDGIRFAAYRQQKKSGSVS